jgi:hypothetical protein
MGVSSLISSFVRFLAEGVKTVSQVPTDAYRISVNFAGLSELATFGVALPERKKGPWTFFLLW